MPRCLLLIVGLLVALALDAASQTSTGRHRVQRVEPEAEARHEDSPRSGQWYLSVGAGLATSGDVLRIRTAGTSGIDWAPPGGPSFSSSDVRLTLEEGIALVLGGGRRLSSRWWARLDMSVSSIDLVAEARRGELVESLLWDRFGLLTASAGLEYRLVELPSFPYLAAGLGVVRIADNGDGQFDQTRRAWRLAAGYHRALTTDWSLRFEVRDAVADLDLAGYVPPVTGTLTPDFDIEELGPLQLFELFVAMTGRF